MKTFSFVIALAVASLCDAATPQLRFAWNEVDYSWATPADRENALKDKTFVPENNLPLGIARWKNKLFVTVPRWKSGVASSLNYIDVDGPSDQPLKPYPSFKDHLFADSSKQLPTNSSVVSVFRIRVDACDRLWVVDTGLADRLGSRNRVSGNSLLVFDLNTDTLIHRYYFKEEDTKSNSFLGNLVVDADKGKCDDAFAYVADLTGNAIIVYSLKQDDSWRVSHHYLHFDPLAGSYELGGIKFQWADGVFGLALSEPKENGYKTLFFHALSSTKEFAVSTKVLRNYKHIDQHKVFYDFKFLGERGEKSQASASDYDIKNNVLFYTQVHRDGIGCWNSNKPFTPENNPLIFTDRILYDFPNDVKLDDEGTLWFLTDRLPRFRYQSLDRNEVNYRIFSISIADAIAGTACQA